jgi:hypothetical protein
MRHFKMGLMAMAMILAAVSCGTRGQKKNAAAEAPETKATEAVQEPETYSQAIDRYLTEVIGAQYGSGEVCIPYHDYISADESRQDDIQVWGSYWVDNYNVVGDTLMFVSGGNHAGKMHVKKDSAGNYFAPGLDAVGDGSNYLPTARAIFGDRFDEFQKAHSDQDLREQIRMNAISGYVFKNHLGVKYYKDYGWPAVRIPNPVDSSRR